ncbi:MAG: hypothetical protein M3Q71_05650 [Chloroflexota bacterium]|nr:hypothetical protein [Chloroflexota bacterium]
MSLWAFLRCFFSRSCSTGYDPDRDEFLTHYVRPQTNAAHQKASAIRRLRTSRIPLHDELYRVTSEEADHGR